MHDLFSVLRSFPSLDGMLILSTIPTLAALSEILKGHKFVGIVDYDLSLSLLQQSTRLYLIDHAALACVLPRRRVISAGR